MSRRKRVRPHANHELWLVSYADFITLLFAFRLGASGPAQGGQAGLAIQVAFQELGVFPASTTQIPLDTNEPMPFSTVQTIQNAKRTTELGRVSPTPNGALDAVSEETNLSLLQNELQQALQHEIALHAVALHRETEGLVISLREFGFFDSGSAALKPSALPAWTASLPSCPRVPAACALKDTLTTFPSTPRKSHPTGSFQPPAPPNWSGS